MGSGRTPLIVPLTPRSKAALALRAAGRAALRAHARSDALACACALAALASLLLGSGKSPAAGAAAAELFDQLDDYLVQLEEKAPGWEARIREARVDVRAQRSQFEEALASANALLRDGRLQWFAEALAESVAGLADVDGAMRGWQAEGWLVGLIAPIEALMAPLDWLCEKIEDFGGWRETVAHQGRIVLERGEGGILLLRPPENAGDGVRARVVSAHGRLVITLLQAGPGEAFAPMEDDEAWAWTIVPIG
ncbi:MAG: hypothetical protein D6771_03495 [Zetaproteobacteria bacterium]|nr:MAG: hypothetical protein D6771_03495 [Zetaproteobacteria bacterium]